MSNDEVLFTIEADDTAIATGESPKFSGPFKVRLSDPQVGDTDAGNKRLRFALDIEEDPSGRNQEGCLINSGQNLPSGPKAHIQRRFFATLLESFGVRKPGRKLQVRPSDLDGKVGYIMYTTPEDKGDEYGNVDFLSKARYEKAADRIRARAEAGELPTTVASEEDDSDGDFELPDNTSSAADTSHEDVINL